MDKKTSREGCSRFAAQIKQMWARRSSSLEPVWTVEHIDAATGNKTRLRTKGRQSRDLSLRDAAEEA